MEAGAEAKYAISRKLVSKMGGSVLRKANYAFSVVISDLPFELLRRSDGLEGRSNRTLADGKGRLQPRGYHPALRASSLLLDTLLCSHQLRLGHSRMVKSIPRLADLSFILSISDSSAEEQFWQAQHTALHLVHKKLSPRSTPSILTSHKQSRSRDSLLALVGCQDGSVWVLDTGRNKKTEAQTANIHVEDTDGSPGSSKLGTPAPSIRNGSPMLSRTSSSTLLHNAALSPPSLSRGDFSSLPQDGAASPKPGRQRTPSILSPNSKPETFSGLGFLPSLGTTGKARSTSVSQSTATARLTSISAADDKALRIKLKDVNRDPADEVAGSLLRLVGDARGGLGELHGRSDTERSSSKSTNKSKPSPRDIKIAIPPPRSASEIRDEEKLDLDVAEAIHEEEEMGRLREAVENAEERSCRECEPINESVENGSTTHNPFLVDLVPQSKFGGSIVALTSSPCDDLVFALSASGYDVRTTDSDSFPLIVVFVS